MHEDTKGNDLQEIITQAIEDIKKEQGDKFDPILFSIFTFLYNPCAQIIRFFTANHLHPVSEYMTAFPAKQLLHFNELLKPEKTYE